MELKKLKVLMDLEMMRLELIPFSVNAQDVIAGWPEEKKRRFFRKFRKIARKAARHCNQGICSLRQRNKHRTPGVDQEPH